MASRDSSTADRAFLMLVWVGIAGFVVLHSYLLLRAGGEQTRALFRLAWFAGLGVVAALLVYFTVRERPAAVEG